MSAGQDFLVGSQSVDVWARVWVAEKRTREMGSKETLGRCIMEGVKLSRSSGDAVNEGLGIKVKKEQRQRQ